MKDIFSGLDDLGFENVDGLNLYGEKDKKENEPENDFNENSLKDLSHLYDKKLTCPVCGASFTVKAIKTSSYRMKGKDSDFFIRYELVNPYFYDVWLCNSCGYAAMKADFEKIKSFQKDLVKQNITSRWRGRTYTEPYDLAISIERYKLSLLNYVYMDAPASKKAMNCLKLAWMNRLEGDSKMELEYLNQSLKGFNDAYFNEDFPIYGMDRFTTMYLIGELNRRIGNGEEAMLWFSKVITTPSVNKRLKELARDQKDLIKCVKSDENKDSSESYTTSSKKKGFLSSLFTK
ncbi:hypothetical protein CLHOM_09280 [Clostridium homopropionicum DSM 5847]|uniref:DUF2225 domain-containing protein n=1 Tax=Clostridium homopropionicum DSM 5847 TaxID=1121318 RepID=A0A0L6ZCT9_9CLOT|nr:DUF2225 domain-containing protein [Clostridium homopropionicum]KOA20785.1 hypothetical protein CLHOM_09280 [Clostridium homopropionicum DSM 5847]SFF89210.1 hypothetical protein SAMN04488501_10371 [Clostridium homopropionicum]